MRSLDYTLDIVPEGSAAPGVIAKFRHRKTALAYENAAPNIKAALYEAGIGFGVYNSGAPKGSYPAKDLKSQRYLEHCITDAVANLRGARRSGSFDISDMVDQLGTVVPHGPIAVWGDVLPHSASKPAFLAALGVLAWGGLMVADILVM